jgi:hypothetical protein
MIKISQNHYNAVSPCSIALVPLPGLFTVAKIKGRKVAPPSPCGVTSVSNSRDDSAMAVIPLWVDSS